MARHTRKDGTLSPPRRYFIDRDLHGRYFMVPADWREHWDRWVFEDQGKCEIEDGLWEKYAIADIANVTFENPEGHEDTRYEWHPTGQQSDIAE